MRNKLIMSEWKEKSEKKTRKVEQKVWISARENKGRDRNTRIKEGIEDRFKAVVKKSQEREGSTECRQ